MIRMFVVFLRASIFDAKMDRTVALANNPTAAMMSIIIWKVFAEKGAVVVDNVTFSKIATIDWEVFEAMSQKLET